MNQEKLFDRDFTIMIFGQIASLLGNAVLRFALSLYILDQTGSAAVFGGILAVSMLPVVIFAPFGGLLADRMDRRGIMVALDYTTAALIACFALFFLGKGTLPVAVIMTMLGAIQSFYQPSVQASIPVLSSDGNLERANGVVIQVNALAALLGPILGGLFYGFLGIRTILICSGLCFFLSACMELFLRIPFHPEPQTEGIFAMVRSDLGAAIRFLVYEKPSLLKLVGILAMLNMVLSAAVMVGLPYLVKVYLGLPSQHYGFAQGVVAVGSILAGCLSGVLARRFAFRESHRLLMLAGATMLPVGITVMSAGTPLFSYAVILVSVLACMFFAALYSIFAQSFAQRETPPQMLGKVGSFVSMICVCSLPLGQAVYGLLFDRLSCFVSLILFFSCGASLLIGVAAGKIQKTMPA